MLPSHTHEHVNPVDCVEAELWQVNHTMCSGGFSLYLVLFWFIKLTQLYLLNYSEARQV